MPQLIKTALLMTMALAVAPSIEAQTLDAIRNYADNGNPDAQLLLGMRYKDGEGIRKDDAEAVKWFTRAAEQGHAGAQFALGMKYQDGEGVPLDREQAAVWYRKSAEQGNEQAQLLLGLLYWDGEGVSKNSITAYQWASVARENGNSDAFHALVVMAGEMRLWRVRKAERLSAKCLESAYKLCR